MQQYKFNTPLIISTVGTLYKNILGVIAKTKSLELDLSLVTNVDSAGVAFLLELKSIAKQNGCKLNFTKTPDIIEHFCQLYKVTL